MTTAMKMLSVHIVTESSPRMWKEAEGSGAPSVSRGVMKNVHLVAVTVFHLHVIVVHMTK